jgi:hypothetical protein
MYTASSLTNSRTPVEQIPFALTSPIGHPSSSRGNSKKGMSEKDLKAAVSANYLWKVLLLRFKDLLLTRPFNYYDYY